MNLIKRKNCIRRPGAALILGATTSLALLALAGCGQKQQNFTPPPPEVGVVTIQAEPLPITTEDAT